ncbi:MAG: 6-phosphogluconolactonase [Candidatus Thermofonsia Clade 1 bacterium]|uniref:6-phosphogluconolactonase n=1 Tax=Candidatus Thermofonsia Clade 1 bacterium TaxID=2364210 RepID=A0A2M8PEJ5_9CHLR|nr:MAG: 6-phosphogluconolactonase [Candidatus Thermofonsia Clade 1 bacterium]
MIALVQCVGRKILMQAVTVYRDLADLTWAAAALIIKLGAQALAERGAFHLALSGGKTPLPLYALLALPEWRVRLDWSRVHIYFADERCVPPDHAESNYGMVQRALLEPVGLPEANVHRMRGEDAPEQAAEAYNALLRNVRLDLILLGMGEDAHTASLFPETVALNETERACVANYVPKLSAWRLTLTAPYINTAQHKVFLVSGAEKAQALHAVLHGAHDPQRYPAQLIREAQWLVDQAAATPSKRA